MELCIKHLSPSDLQDLIKMFPEITNHGTVKNDSSHPIDRHHETGILELILSVSPAVVSLAIEIIKYIRDSKQKKESRANTLIFNNCTFVVNNKSELNLNMDDILNALKNE